MTAAKFKDKPEAKKDEAEKAKVRKNEKLDDALDDSFPASDPPSMTTPTVPGSSDK